MQRRDSSGGEGTAPSWPPTPLAPNDPSTQERSSQGCRSLSPGDKRAAKRPLISGRATCPQARLAGEARAGNRTCSANPTCCVPSPRPPPPPAGSARLLHRERGAPGSDLPARPQPWAPALPAACAPRRSGRAGGGPAPALSRLTAAEGSAGSPSAAGLAASNRLHCDAARSAGQSQRGGANR